MKFRRYVCAAFLSVMMLTVAAPAFASAVLFNATGFLCGLYTCGPFGGPYGSGSTVTNAVGYANGSSPASFSFNGKLMQSGPWTYTAQLTGYPYFYAGVSRYIRDPHFQPNYWPAGSTYTQMRDENIYPNAAPTAVADAYLQLKIGPNGFGGPMFRMKDEIYKGLVTGVGVGSSTLLVDFTAMLNANKDPDFAFETRTNLQTFGVTGIVWAWNPQNPHMTGTAMIYAPTGVVSHVSTHTGMDNRNAAGTTGALSLVAPGLIASFGTGTGAAPTRMEDTHMATLVTVARDMFKISLTFVPEPAQMALLGSGVLVLLGLGWTRRRK